MIFNKTEILGLDRFYRANLINSIVGIKQASLIGTVSNKNISNLALFSSVVHLGSNPQLVAMFCSCVSFYILRNAKVFERICFVLKLYEW